MFEGFQKHQQSFFLIVLVASVATIFGVSRGPARGCSEGSISVVYAARIDGRTVTESEFNSQLSFARQVVPGRAADPENQASEGALRQGVLDGLIERELLAHEAERLGFRVTDAEVNDRMRACEFYLSLGVASTPMLRTPSGRLPAIPNWCTHNGEAGTFDYATFERSVRRVFHRTPADLRETMIREMLAQKMRDAVAASVSVSDEEMWRDYQRTHDRTAVKYLRFSVPFYRDVAHDDDAAAVAAWAAAHAQDVTHQYERRRDTLRGLHHELHFRHIEVHLASDATPAQRAEAHAKADALHARLAAGEDFVRLARLYSDDPSDWRAGGEQGWREATATAGLSQPVLTALLALQPDGVSPVVEEPGGYQIVQLLGTRQGDVPEAEARREIARTLYREAHAAELAQQAAQAAQHRLTGGATLDDIGREVHTAALREFYRGEVPAAITLAGTVVLAPVEHTDIGAPEVKETEQFNRTEPVVEGLDHGEALTVAAFALTPEHPVGAEPVHIDEDWFVLRFKDGSRTTATREEFARQRQELMDTTFGSMLAARQRDAMQEYVARLRQEAEHEGQVRVGNSPRLRAPTRTETNEEEGN